MPDLTPTRAASLLGDAVSLWRISPGSIDDVIDAAVECLVAGIDSPTLRELAGASPRESQFVLEPLIGDTLRELGMLDVLETSVQRGALAAMLHRLKDNRVSARDLTRWAHTHIGHDGDAECQVFVELDDVYDAVDDAVFGPEELDRWTREAADAFLEGRLPPSHRPWRISGAACRKWACHGATSRSSQTRSERKC
jgi:hypothetical protein